MRMRTFLDRLAASLASTSLRQAQGNAAQAADTSVQSAEDSRASTSLRFGAKIVQDWADRGTVTALGWTGG